MSTALQKYLSLLWDTIFGRSCFFCGTAGELLCSDCQALCDIALTHSIGRGRYYDDCYSACSYRNRYVKKLIAAFKYEPFCRQLSKPLARLLVNHLEAVENKNNFSSFTIIPVPLSKQRRRWRGYNQSEELADELSAALGLPLDCRSLIRIKNTECQVGLSAEQRLTNVAKAFVCPIKNSVGSKNILLIDDVMTTGATMEECAKILKENGAAAVIAVVIAHAEIADL